MRRHLVAFMLVLLLAGTAKSADLSTTASVDSGQEPPDPSGPMVQENWDPKKNGGLDFAEFQALKDGKTEVIVKFRPPAAPKKKGAAPDKVPAKELSSGTERQYAVKVPGKSSPVKKDQLK